MNKVILVLNGPLCAGKSTIIEELMTRDGYFKASPDRVKWLISNYSAENPGHRDITKEITLGMTAKAIEMDLSILVDGGHHKYRAAYKKLANDNDLTYVSINIEAPYAVLKDRFLERVERSSKIDRPSISVTTIEGFDQRYKWYLEENKDNEADETLDSSTLDLKEIIGRIDTLLK